MPSRANRIEFVELDVTSKASITAACKAIKAPLAAIINNAGIATGSLADILAANVHGPHDCTDAFLPLLDPTHGRVVMISSASGPNFVSKCSPERQAFFKDPSVTWDQIEGVMKEAAAGGAPGLPAHDDWFAYGLSKACVNQMTMLYAREHPAIKFNACSPGYIETDLTRPMADAQRKSPAECGMKPPEAGAYAPVFLAMDGDVTSSGWYYGSDAKRSPLDRYRAPGDPEYDGV
ncbi:hypothetical protein FOA52_002935 [Chlamydomonas sp. UWO 241]|nr:hypothetical protein FOA52_002935 [Chlamydomonas sp. UWO 241]